VTEPASGPSALAFETRAGENGRLSKVKRQMRAGFAKSGIAKASMPSARLLLTLLCLFAFSVQSFIAQTHIHRPGTTDIGIAVVNVAGKSLADGSHAKAPETPANPADEAAKCPLCQAVAHFGFVVSPALLVLFLPRANTDEALPDFLRVAKDNVPSHAWHSRGPPQH
jgi:hypothetical protein